MSASQGREGRTRARLGWLGAAVAASGLHVAAGASPALACHIAQHAPAPQGLRATADNPAQDYQNLMNLWNQVKAQNQAAEAAATKSVTTTSATSPARSPAAEVLPTATATPTVANWHQAQPSTCTPPPPTCTCSVPTGTTSPSSAPIPLTPPAAQTLPTPEPSTLLTALLLAGGLAWRRRSGR